MALSPITDSPSFQSDDPDHSDNNLQPFFVLHKPSAINIEKKPLKSGKVKRKIDLAWSPSKPAAETHGPRLDEDADAIYEKLRLEAFNLTWSKIESIIKEVLKKINLDGFSEVYQWVSESFKRVKEIRATNISEIQQPFPLVTDTICKQIPTAFIFTKNVEFIDDLITFQELGYHLQSYCCLVIHLSALEFSAKHGVGGSLKSLLRQIVTDVDVADITVLASWYYDLNNQDHPIIVIIDDMERCNPEVLAEFITLLSEWVIKIPVFFIMGVSTTVDAPRKLLPSNALQRLRSYKFTLGSPREKMDALIESVLVEASSGFSIGHKVAIFLRNYFLKNDGTITSLIRALKIACIEHFSLEPLSFLGLGMLDENHEEFWLEKCEALPTCIIQHAFDLPSCQREIFSNGSPGVLVKALSNLKAVQRNWSSVVLCLFEVGKMNKMQLLDIFCESADPSLINLSIPDQNPQISSLASARKCSFTNEGFLAQARQKVRELSLPSLSQLLNMWSIHTKDVNEIHSRVTELQSMTECGDASHLSEESAADILKRSRSISAGKGLSLIHDKAAILLDDMIRNFLTPIESAPFHEIICFRNVDALQSALIGDPRRTIQVDLLKSKSHLQCSCCNKEENIISPSMHDTSIMYNLAQEYGDLINLHDWYQSFKATTGNASRPKSKAGQSPAKKTKAAPQESEATIQARFCKAITELQITGLLRMPSKRRPDFVQRVAFGI